MGDSPNIDCYQVQATKLFKSKMVAVNVRAVTHITYHITLSDLTMTHNIPPHLELIRKKEHITHIPLTDLIMTHIIPTHLDLSNSMKK